MTLYNLLTNVGKTLKANSPEILAALSVSGVVTTSYLAAKASFDASSDLRMAPPDLPIKEKIKVVWKLYIPAGISGALTIGCIVGSSKASGKRTAAAVTAYSLTEKAFSEYKEKVVEQLGKNKEQAVRDDIAQDKVNRTQKGSKEVIILGEGHVLCCELYTHRYFRSDMETLRKAQNDINARIINNRYVSLGDFYYFLGLPFTSASDALGWDSDKLMALEFSTVLSDNGEPCLAFDYNYLKPI